MSMLKNLTTLSLFLLSMSALASTSPQTISVISHGKSVASFKVPDNTKIEISADKHQASKFTGNAKLLLTFPSGEVMNIEADELAIEATAS
ncbi:hypothetical protein [Pantoea cypripedii]|uniref:Uncharacterized protein n=1 Tax=Pantoea cypripedii TaxID=55209 RepID=A0A6B9G347_PANCY|nr:hypothetical protein [Pantoea cypripedii]QGY29210.1 hypothetical protein CUN67_09825 [Pantoea cypripedii]